MSSTQKSTKRIAVIMCAWKRAHRFERTLQMLAGQDDLDFDFYVWNNNPENNEHIDSVADSYQLPYKLTIHHSEENKKGFGRFYWAQQLTDDYDYFVFVDDDQDFGGDFISTFREECNPNIISGFWGSIYDKKSYWDHPSVNYPGTECHYMGTGGQICPSRVFKEEKFFTDIPEEFYWIEDLWLSFYFTHFLGGKLFKSKNQLLFDYDGLDQTSMTERVNTPQDRFLCYLYDEYGWLKGIIDG